MEEFKITREVLLDIVKSCPQVKVALEKHFPEVFTSPRLRYGHIYECMINQSEGLEYHIIKLQGKLLIVTNGIVIQTFWEVDNPTKRDLENRLGKDLIGPYILKSWTKKLV